MAHRVVPVDHDAFVVELHPGVKDLGGDLVRGSELPAARTPSDFRGPEMPALARSVARADGVVDARCVGRGLDGMSFTPPTPQGDPDDSLLQRFKRLWHCVLRFGADADPPTNGHTAGGA